MANRFYSHWNEVEGLGGGGKDPGERKGSTIPRAPYRQVSQAKDAF